MRLVGDVNDGAGEMLVALAEVVDMVNQRDIADGKLRFIAFAGKGGEILRVISASGYIVPSRLNSSPSNPAQNRLMDSAIS